MSTYFPLNLGRFAGLPCVPYIGIFLTDLIFINEGNPDELKGTNLVNFDKCVMIANVIQRIQSLQQVPYCLQPIPEIQSYLSDLQILEEKELFELSLQREPRIS